ncbi:MAG: hypothetical protein ACRD96_25270, partial [Bryobacteraceae bacterium]
FQSIVDTEDYTHPLANFSVAGELADWVRAAAPRPVIVAGAVDAAGRPVDPREAGRVYRDAPNVDVRPAADWSIAALEALA